MNLRLLDLKVKELSEEARPVFHQLALAVRKASDGDPALSEQANVAVLLAADALGRHREPVREQRWRRLVRALEPFAQRCRSDELRSLVAENRDLL
jgi:hypothetical protein